MQTEKKETNRFAYIFIVGLIFFGTINTLSIIISS